MEYHFIAVEGILGVRTNIKEFKWGFGSGMPLGTAADYKKCKVKIHFRVEDFDDDGLVKQLGKYSYFYGTAGSHTLYYLRRIAGNSKLRIKAENLLSEEPKITVNKHYYRLVKHNFMNLHSVYYLLTDLATFLLLRQGFASIYCSSFKKGDAAVAIFAPPHTGKTLSCMMACSRYGANFIAEDLAVTDGEFVYPVLWTNTYRTYKGLERNWGEIRKASCKAKITHLAILERGDSGTIQETAEETVRKLLNLNRYGFNYLKSPLLIAYGFFNLDLNVDEGFRNEERLLNSLSYNSIKRVSVQNRNAANYAAMLLKEMQDDNLTVRLQQTLT